MFTLWHIGVLCTERYKSIMIDSGKHLNYTYFKDYDFAFMTTQYNLLYRGIQ